MSDDKLRSLERELRAGRDVETFLKLAALREQIFGLHPATRCGFDRLLNYSSLLRLSRTLVNLIACDDVIVRDRNNAFHSFWARLDRVDYDKRLRRYIGKGLPKIR